MYDSPALAIAVADAVTSKSWRNTQITWDEFKKKCRNIHRTPETYARYMQLSRKDQGTIKGAVGGYLGGELSGGRRVKDAVTFRSILTLDADFAKPEMWPEFKAKTDFAVCVHSTHKHSEKNPRLRINIPFEREVRVDEYEPIARMIASDIGMNYMDHTSYQASRLMFWPSASADADTFYDEVEGPFLSPDDILARYNNWADASQWPIGDNEIKAIKSEAIRQGDPLTKEGWIGAFCRAFTIEAAIDNFLSDRYERCDVPDRYTFIGGTTAAGAVVYEDKFLYSHHSSDPISTKLCNAFDLVRLHLFREDGDVEEFGDDSESKRKSMLSMKEFCRGNAEVRAQMKEDDIQAATEAYKDMLKDIPGVVLGSDSEDPFAWVREMDMESKGVLSTCVKNIRMILENDPRLKGRIGFNLFTGRLTVLDSLPWKKEAGGRPWTDDDWSSLRCLIGEHPYKIKRTPIIEDVVGLLKTKWEYHPVKDYLERCVWDKVPRMERVFIDYLGAEDSEYVKQVTRKALLACIARIYQPGIKFDNMPVLAGPQGIGKSWLLRKLGVSWFTSNFDFHMLSDPGGKKAIEQIQGRWIVEVGEMAGYRKVEAAKAKSFLSETEDEFRPSYGRETVVRPRQCVFFASTNEERPLQDNNGNRRFWVINLFGGRIPPLSPFDMSAQDVAQIWAEAMHCYHVAEEGIVLSKEMEEEANRQQKEHEERDEREGEIRRFLDMRLPSNWDEMDIGMRRSYIGNYGNAMQQDGDVVRQKVSISEIWSELFGKPKSDMDSQRTKFIHKILRATGEWKIKSNKEEVKQHGRERVYVRITDENWIYL